MKTTEEIWHEYHNKLASWIRSRVTEDTVDDLLQDVFIKIHSRIDSLKENTKLEHWLYKITRNTVIDYYRSKRPADVLPDWIEQPESDLNETIRKELSTCLEPMIEQLPDKYRITIQLSEIDGKTQRMVAKEQGISLSGTKSRVQRGRSLLKGMLYKCCEFELNKNKQLIDYNKKRSDSDCC